jgi:hypothetical protein
MNATELLSKVKVASPCRARWGDMSGDDKSRFCGQCHKRVYNFSAMSAAEAAELIRAKEGNLCGRFYRRRDGTVLTTNCPIGAQRYFLRRKALTATAVTLLLTSLGVRGWSNGNLTGKKGAFAQKCDALIWTVKGWFDLNPKVTMGVVCLPLSPPATPPLPAGISQSGSEDAPP